MYFALYCLDWKACEYDDEEWDEDGDEDDEFELDWSQSGGNLKIVLIHFKSTD